MNWVRFGDGSGWPWPKQAVLGEAGDDPLPLGDEGAAEGLRVGGVARLLLPHGLQPLQFAVQPRPVAGGGETAEQLRLAVVGARWVGHVGHGGRGDQWAASRLCMRKEPSPMS